MCACNANSGKRAIIATVKRSVLNQLFLSAYGLYLTHMHSVELTLDIVPCSYQMGRVQQTLIPTQLLSVQLFKRNFESSRERENRCERSTPLVL